MALQAAMIHNFGNGANTVMDNSKVWQWRNQTELSTVVSAPTHYNCKNKAPGMIGYCSTVTLFLLCMSVMSDMKLLGPK